MNLGLGKIWTPVPYSNFTSVVPEGFLDKRFLEVPVNLTPTLLSLRSSFSSIGDGQLSLTTLEFVWSLCYVDQGTPTLFYKISLSKFWMYVEEIPPLDM